MVVKASVIEANIMAACAENLREAERIIDKTLQDSWEPGKTVTVETSVLRPITVAKLIEMYTMAGWDIRSSNFSNQMDGSGTRFAISKAERPSFDPRG